MKKNIFAIEEERLRLQQLLDREKNPKDRNRLGQFATPPGLADEIITYSLKLLDKEEIRFLDPAIGTGVFYSSLLKQVHGFNRIQAVGFEIDPHYAQPAIQLWRSTKLQIIQGDFTRQKSPDKANELYDLVVCNPPYVRHHHLSASEKQRLGKASVVSSGIRLSGLAGLYAYFVSLSHEWMADDGIAAWLIPSEFLDVNYGRGIKTYLLQKVSLVRIHRFEASDVQFDDALVTSSVVWFQKRPPRDGHTVTMSHGGLISKPKTQLSIKSSALSPDEKWSIRINGNGRRVSGAPTLGDYFTVKRGIATGANKFFILTLESIEELKLPRLMLVPILPGPRLLLVDEVRADAKGNPVVNPTQFVIDCKLPEDEVRSKYPQLWKYLVSGKAEVAVRYICRHREPWYSQETREPAPFLCTYIGRADSARGTPFRFILNHSKAVATNVYLLLYPKSPLQEMFEKEPRAYREVLAIMNGIAPEVLKNCGRVYGGGLHKLEPHELLSLPVPRLHQHLSEWRHQWFLKGVPTSVEISPRSLFPTA
jgi:predicted RNA methylase